MINLKTWSLLDWWFKPQDVRVTRMFEFLLCISMVYYFSGHLQTPEWWLTDKGFHVSAEATSAHYLPPPPLLPREWVMPAVYLFYTLGGVYLLGYGRRFLNPIFFALCVYIQAMDQPSSFTINRLLIVYFFMLSFQPSEEIVEGKRVVSGWLVRIIQLTLVFQYLGAGICKWYGGNWLDNVGGGIIGSMNYTIWSQAQGHYKNLISAWAINTWPSFMWGGFAWGTLIVETLSPMLFFVRYKNIYLWAILAAFLMHLGIAVLMKDLIYFSFQMVCSYVFFLPDKWMTTFVEKLQDKFPFWKF